ncbi:S1C family serine protease [Luteococcus sp. Sow4_B9]|uniref:S1C family serine protease n=1 Tax=Luteococcus sp. Sow4_B9 TaxID=3438792 RepID=UPI003F9D224F
MEIGAPRLAAGAIALALVLGGCSAPSDPEPNSPAGLQSGSAAAPSGSAAAQGQDQSGAGQTRSGQAGQPHWADVAAKVSPSVVAISVQGGGGASSGSGVVLDSQGLVVTNHHVIASAARGGQILVTLADERVVDATVVGSDSASDLAVLRMARPPSGLQPITMGSSDDLVVGDPVMAIGNPLGLAGTVTTGIVSALNRPVTAGDQSGQLGGQEPVVTNAIQTSAPVNPGNSGGALVDGEGRLVGINSSIATLGQGSGNIGISFAITVKQMRSVVDQIVQTGSAKHSYLGAGVTDAIVKVGEERRWAAGIVRVEPGSAAATAQLRARDGVLAIDGEPVDSALALIAQIRERPVGEKVELTVAREGKEQKVQVTLTARPS